MNSYQITTANLSDTKALLAARTLNNDELGFILTNLCSKLEGLSKIQAVMIGQRTTTPAASTETATKGTEPCPATKSANSTMTNSSTSSPAEPSTPNRQTAASRPSPATATTRSAAPRRSKQL